MRSFYGRTIRRSALLTSLIPVLAPTSTASLPKIQNPKPKIQNPALLTPLIRVGLTHFATETTLIVSALPGAYFAVAKERLKAGSGPWRVTWEGGEARIQNAGGHEVGRVRKGQSWRLQAEAAETLLQIATPAGKPRRYYGGLEIYPTPTGLRVVNTVNLETYLRGVVLGEIGGQAPLEALKAQAVAARTFTLAYAERRNVEEGDLPDNETAQVYSGADLSSPLADQAIQETAGEVLTRAGQPFLTQYGADCGGATAPGDSFPMVEDRDVHANAEGLLPPTWTLRLSVEMLTPLLAKVPALRQEGKLDGMEVLEKDTSERVLRLRLTWHQAEGEAKQEPMPLPEKKTTAEISGNTLRRLIGYSRMPSTLFTVRKEAEGTFVLEGRGRGHGHGMCQIGAIRLAQSPRLWDYRAILQRYYPGATCTVLREEHGKE